jgi:hypothetical protein
VLVHPFFSSAGHGEVDAAKLELMICTGFSGVNDKLNDVASSLKEMQQSLDNNQRSTSSMLKSLLAGEYGRPRCVCILPRSPPPAGAGSCWSGASRRTG